MQNEMENGVSWIWSLICKKKKKTWVLKHWYHEWRANKILKWQWAGIENISYNLAAHELFVIKALLCCSLFNHSDQMPWNDSVYLSYGFLIPQNNQQFSFTKVLVALSFSVIGSLAH